MQNFLAIHKNPFFPDFGRVLTHFWPFYWAWAVGPVKGSQTKRLRKNLKNEKNRFFFKYAEFSGDEEKHIFS